MASLTHVCMWENKGWRRVSAAEAARKNPYKVSAHSHFFMCELCGQYVLFANGEKNVPHFRHSSAEADKSCPERTIGAGAQITYQANEHETPLRISSIKGNDFSFELGFVRIPDELFDSRLRIEIKGVDYGSSALVYSGERLLSDRTTYLSVGSNPCSSYKVSVTNCDNVGKLNQYWPRKYTGVDPAGTVFSSDSRKKLPNGADVVVGKHYYILKLGKIGKQIEKHITVRQICSKTISFNTWNVYDVVANDYSEASAKFFLNFHCLLTNNPISMVPVWPECIREPYIIKHDSDSMILSIEGEYVKVHSFPYANIEELENSVIKVSIKDRQQLVSAGRGSALQYSYYWREPLDKVNELPHVKVTDVKGNAIYAGNNVIPKQGVLLLKAPYDGFVIKKIDETIIEKMAISAQKEIELFDICEDTEILIYVGLDLVWKAAFTKKKISKKNNDAELLAKLNESSGNYIELPANMGALYSRLNEHPEVQKWIKSRVLIGTISENAYVELKALALSKLKERK